MMGNRAVPVLIMFFLFSGLRAQSGGPDRVSEALSLMEQAGASMQEEEYTPLDEYTIGRAVSAGVLSRYRPLRNAEGLNRYLNCICEALVVNVPSPNPEPYNGYHVLVLDSSQINAYATSGGHIFITRGLIDCATSEDVLASVIAHEVAHILLRHNIDAIRTARTVQQLQEVGRDAARQAARIQGLDERRVIFEESIRAAIHTLMDNGYSHTQEYEADGLALLLLVGAGYDPAGLVEMLGILQQRQGVRDGGFDSTHPSPASRISNAERAIRSTPPQADNRPARSGRFRAFRR